MLILLLTIIGFVLAILGLLSGVFYLRSSVGLWSPNTDDYNLMWLMKFGIFTGCVLIFIAWGF